MYRSLLIVDDFYPRPDEVRDFALAADYPDANGFRTFPGRNSGQRLAADGLDDVVSGLVGEPVAGALDDNVHHCRFRVTLAGESSRYRVHVDPTHVHWVGLVYMTRDEHSRGGTSFYRHKCLGSDRTPIHPKALRRCGAGTIAELLARDGNDMARWQHLMTVPMRFNRLVLYRPWLWHSATEGFGGSLDDGRLVQLVAFRSADQRTSARPRISAIS